MTKLYFDVLHDGISYIQVSSQSPLYIACCHALMWYDDSIKRSKNEQSVVIYNLVIPGNLRNLIFDLTTKFGKNKKVIFQLIFVYPSSLPVCF